MAWVRIDDGFHQHRKIAKAGPLATALHVAGLCHSSHYLTDGFIPEHVLPMLVNFEEMDALLGEPGKARRLALEKLMQTRLWTYDEEQEGYWIHDYLDYNPSAQEVKAKREQDRNRKRPSAHGDMSDSKRNPNGIQTESKPPVPVPQPEVKASVPPKPPKGSSVTAEKPIDLVIAMCKPLGADISTIAPKERDKQCALAKGLLEQGYSADKVERCTAYLRSQHWRDGTIDMRTLTSEIGAWELNGEPERAEPKRQSAKSNGAAPHSGSAPRPLYDNPEVQPVAKGYIRHRQTGS